MMYSEPERQIPVIAQVDVLVLGAGPAGMGAAVWAARTGAKTMLVEQTGDVGGISTVGLMSHWTGRTAGGFYEEVLGRSADLSDTLEDYGFNGSPRQIINPERLKTVFLQMIKEAGIRLRLYTFASDVIMKENTLCGVILESKSGREAVMAKVVIDCTGDGDIAAKTGAEYVKGREFSVGVIDFQALPIIEIAPVEGFYDYKNKYKAGSTVETCPAELSEQITKEMHVS